MPRSYAIVIPTRNEEKYIEKCVLSCLQQEGIQTDVDVFVADGMSTDATPSLVRDLVKRHPRLHLIENYMQTTPQGLNAGIRATGADVVIILGGHAELAPDYVAQCEAAFAISPDIGCVGGIIENVYDTPESKSIGLAMSSPFGVGNARFRTGGASGFVDTVAFGAYKHEVFDKIGLFDEELVRNQDDEFNYRLTAAGYKIWLSPQIKSSYHVRTGYSKLRSQFYQYGYWKVYVNKKHGAVTTLRQLAPAGFIAWLASIPFTPLLFPLHICLGLIYLFTAYYFAQRMTTHYNVLLVLKAFLIMHIAYGTGYWIGIWDFLIRRKSPSAHSQKLTR
jgi:GT2 family glycosyltransferase